MAHLLHEGRPKADEKSLTTSRLKYRTLDGNEAVASIAYRLNEVVAIYPITPASPMGEYAVDRAGRGPTWNNQR